jgi:hypothetical protein
VWRRREGGEKGKVRLFRGRREREREEKRREEKREKRDVCVCVCLRESFREKRRRKEKKDVSFVSSSSSPHTHIPLIPLYRPHTRTQTHTLSFYASFRYDSDVSIKDLQW